jgi:hypothetical protein
VASARSSTVSEVTGTLRLALVLDVAGSPTLTPRLALVLDVAGSPAFTPGCLLLRMVAAFALMIAVLALLSLALAVAVLAPLSLALAVAALPCQRARRRDRIGIGLGLLGLRSAVVLDQLLLKVLVAAKVREEQLVLRVQRRALAKDAKVEFVGRLDEASAAQRHGSASSFHPA